MSRQDQVVRKPEGGVGDERPVHLATDNSGNAPPRISARPTYVVGIGASAGGLEALERFFDHMPPDTGMAFVVVPHLSPDFKSLMGELLSKRTRMPVRQITDGIAVEANTIYVIPPRKNMIITGGRLNLSAIESSHGLNLPIDIFFRSLAEDLNDRAIGIVLSGTGSDGTRGIRAIKEAGGVVMVQDDTTAKFDGMPRSAIATGLADHVLPPEEMPQKLLNFTRYPQGMESTSPALLFRPDDNLGEIFSLLRNRHGLDFSQYKSAMVARRIERRMIIHQLEDLGRYLSLLRESPEELKKLYTELLIHVTAFFRDADAFTRVGTLVVRKLIEQAAPEETIRVWVPACSTGEEPYSLAMLFHEEQQALGKPVDVKIFATDVDEQAVEQAGRGVFPASIASDLSDGRLDRFFIRHGDTYQISPQLRKTVIFAPHNVVKDPPFTKIDLIACRNLLIYLQPELQKKVLSMFQFALNPRGYLFLGASETVGELSGDFEALDTKWRIYQKCRPTRLTLDHRSALMGAMRNHPGMGGDVSAQMRSLPAESVLNRAYDTLIADYAPPSLLVNEKHELLYVFGDASRFLHIPPGKPIQDVLRMVSDDLAVVLATAMHKALAESAEVAYQNIHFKESDRSLRVNLRVKPLPRRRFDDKSGEKLLLVTFQERSPSESPASSPEVLDAEGISNLRIADIEQELRQTRENLQATIEELETSNEELQATNEELLAANEELQGTNEELQSVNEELFTVNVEYQKKIAELTEANNDIDNLFRITNIGKIFLDRDGCIRKFTPAVVPTVNLLEHDVGRPIEHISHNLVDQDLAAAVREVLAGGEPITREVRTRNGEWLLMRVLPYRVETRSGEGVIVTFVNISDLKRSEDELRESNLELARSNKELDDFAHIASHDLKDPLHSLVLQCRFLEEDLSSQLGSDGKARLHAVVRQCERMGAMVDSLLQFSQIGRSDLSCQEVDLAAVVRDIVESLEFQISESKTEIRIPHPLPTVRCDPAVSAVFRNLITNALKYNDKPERWIEIGRLENDPALQPVGPQSVPVFYVRDNGIGIRPQDHDSVFQIFRRLHGQDKFGGGTGSGLTFARKIVERHGGRIWIESRPGEGTTFFFTLQAEHNHEPAVTATDSARRRQ